MTDHANLQDLAKQHLMMHFTSQGRFSSEEVPVIERGDGCWVWDTNGKRYFDGMSGLFCTQIGHSYGAELGEAAAKQMAELGFFINWSYAHPRVIELSAKIAEIAPGDLNRTFFCSGGSEANESIIKLARQYHQIRGQGRRYKMIARRTAYHGTTLGALSLTGIASIRNPFEPLLPGVRHVSNTNSYHRPEGETEAEFTAFLLDELRAVIEQEGPETISAFFAEPVQNSGGTFTPPEGYFQGVRAICDEYGILLV
ncbi:MAG TPA: aminotransferase class III-fold pyridoxal phosphate-dependent enzyme, partial [Gaiellales bacterium]|nr:aminotransferase class III-fold pyridoxal phosphate-dependent enzyme [Gaiellales bacterium]